MRRKTTYDPARDYYLILGIDTHVTDDELRLAYRQRVRKVHPDRNPDRREWATEQIKLLNEAYAVLRDPAQRREYNRLRWPHIPHEPPHTRSTYRSPYRSARYDSARPWWEQAAAQRAARSTPGTAASSAGQSATISPRLSQWLSARGLDRFESTLVGLVGLWRSPYSGLLTVLSVVLALNVAAIIYFVMVPADGSGLLASIQEWLSANGGEEVAMPMTATPERLYLNCPDSSVQIVAPVEYAQVGDAFSVVGTVDHPQLWNYAIELGYLGETPPPHSNLPETWRIVRPPPANQSTRESVVIDGPLAGPITLSGERSGYYVLRLRVILQDQSALPLCDVVIQH